jgi:hypothetical protein
VRYGPRLVGDLWLYPENSTLLELSTTCAPSEALQIAVETRAFLTGTESTSSALTTHVTLQEIANRQFVSSRGSLDQQTAAPLYDPRNEGDDPGSIPGVGSGWVRSS